MKDFQAYRKNELLPLKAKKKNEVEELAQQEFGKQQPCLGSIIPAESKNDLSAFAATLIRNANNNSAASSLSTMNTISSNNTETTGLPQEEGTVPAQRAGLGLPSLISGQSQVSKGKSFQTQPVRTLKWPTTKLNDTKDLLDSSSDSNSELNDAALEQSQPVKLARTSVEKKLTVPTLQRGCIKTSVTNAKATDLLDDFSDDAAEEQKKSTLDSLSSDCEFDRCDDGEEDDLELLMESSLDINKGLHRRSGPVGKVPPDQRVEMRLEPDKSIQFKGYMPQQRARHYHDEETQASTVGSFLQPEKSSKELSASRGSSRDLAKDLPVFKPVELLEDSDSFEAEEEWSQRPVQAKPPMIGQVLEIDDDLDDLPVPVMMQKSSTVPINPTQVSTSSLSKQNNLVRLESLQNLIGPKNSTPDIDSDEADMCEQMSQLLEDGQMRKRSNTEQQSQRRKSCDDQDLELQAQIEETKQLPTKIKLDSQLQLGAEMTLEQATLPGLKKKCALPKISIMVTDLEEEKDELIEDQKDEEPTAPSGTENNNQDSKLNQLLTQMKMRKNSHEEEEKNCLPVESDQNSKADGFNSLTSPSRQSALQACSLPLLDDDSLASDLELDDGKGSNLLAMPSLARHQSSQVVQNRPSSSNLLQLGRAPSRQAYARHSAQRQQEQVLRDDDDKKVDSGMEVPSLQQQTESTMPTSQETSSIFQASSNAGAGLRLAAILNQAGAAVTSRGNNNDSERPTSAIPQARRQTLIPTSTTARLLTTSALPTLTRGVPVLPEPSTGMPLASLQENNDDNCSTDSGDLEAELTASLPSLVLRSTAAPLTLQRTSTRNPITSAIHQRRFGEAQNAVAELDADSLSSATSEEDAARQQQQPAPQVTEPKDESDSIENCQSFKELPQLHKDEILYRKFEENIKLEQGHPEWRREIKSTMTARLFAIVSAPCMNFFGSLGMLIFLRMSIVHEMTEVGRTKYYREQQKKKNPNFVAAPIDSELNARFSKATYQDAEKQLNFGNFFVKDIVPKEPENFLSYLAQRLMFVFHFLSKRSEVVMELTRRVTKVAEKAKAFEKEMKAADFERMLTLDGAFSRSTIESLLTPENLLETVLECTDKIIPSASELIWVIKRGRVDKRDIPLYKMLLDFHEAQMHLKTFGESGVTAQKVDLQLQADLQQCQQQFYHGMDSGEFSQLFQQMSLVNNRVGAKIEHFNYLNQDITQKKEKEACQQSQRDSNMSCVLDFILGDRKQSKIHVKNSSPRVLSEQSKRIADYKVELKELVEDLKAMLGNTCGKVIQLKPITCKNYLTNSLFKRKVANAGFSKELSCASGHESSEVHKQCTCQTSDDTKICSSMTSDDGDRYFMLGNREDAIAYFSAAYEAKKMQLRALDIPCKKQGKREKPAGQKRLQQQKRRRGTDRANLFDSQYMV